MINVNQITAQLARMPDQALQRYAQMHKADPYILSLALAESNRRKQMRQGAQMNAPEQPKVADQAIAGMGSGVAALPAPNLQGMEQTMAAGGIVAFDEGGEVERYQDRGLVQPPAFDFNIPGMTTGNLYSSSGAGTLNDARARYLAAVQRAQSFGLRQRRDDPEGFKNALAEVTSAQLAMDAAKNNLANWNQSRQPATPPAAGVLRQSMVPAAPAAAALASPDADFPAAARTRSTAPAANAGPGTSGPRRNTGTPPAAAPAPAASARDPLIAQLLQPVTAAPINFEPSQATFPTLEGIQKLFAANRVKPENVVDPLAERREELTNLAVMQNAQERAELERQIRERGLLGEKQEARLKAREEKLGKQEKDLGPLALLQTGLAIMSGSSPYALQNIGTGAQLGLKGYKEGLEKLDAARERIEDGLERIETARRSEGILNDQQRTALRREGNKIVTDGARDAMNAWQTEFGQQRQEATALTNAGVKMLTDKATAASAERLGAAQMQQRAQQTAQERQSAQTVAAAQLITQRDIAAMEAAVKKGDQAVRMAEVRALAADKSVEAMRKVWAESKVLQSQYPNINDWLTITGKGTAAPQAGQQLSPADKALIEKYVKP